MRRLTPDKLRGYAKPLPDRHLRINKGNTSIIYRTNDPNLLEVFTVEVVKCEWWGHGLDITDDWQYVADAYYSGYEGHSYQRKFKRVYLPVYRCLVRRLDTPDAAQMKRIRQIQRAVSGIGIPPYWSFNTRSIGALHAWRWEQLEALNIPEIAGAVDFALNYDAYSIAPDFGNGDFMVKDGAIVALDPFHHIDVHEAFSLHD